MTNNIYNILRDADIRLLKAQPLLKYTNIIASAFFIISWLIIFLCVMYWHTGILSSIFVIVCIALATSVFHEMEHDLIHDLYFPNERVKNVILTFIWFAKASLDPWTRKRLHLWHHITSGQEEDIEERLIGLGLPWGPLRVLIAILPVASIFLKPGITRDVKKSVKERGRKPNLVYPRGWWVINFINGFLLTLPLIVLCGLFFGAVWAWPVFVLWVMPNIVRHFAISIMSSNSHYVGIRRGVIIEQNQILDHPIFWPLQVFCWNFGATHVLHHFLVRQPFWRRTLIFKDVRQELIDNGVHCNDFGTFVRANRRSS